MSMTGTLISSTRAEPIKQPISSIKKLSTEAQFFASYIKKQKG